MNASNNKILFPVDFQEQSLIGIDYAKYFAEGTKAELVLLHVIEEGNFLTKLLTTPEIQEKAYEEVEKMMTELVAKINYPYSISIQIEYGKVYTKILEVAKKIKPMVILMGKSEVPVFTQRIIGSNAMHLISESTFPVITIRGKKFLTSEDKTNKDILLPLDIEKEVQKQLTVAISYAQYFGANINIINVNRKESKGHEMKVLTRLDKAKKIIENVGIKCNTKIIKDKDTPIYKIINEEANNTKSRLIVIMTHDEGGVVDYFVGHNALDIISQAEIPVLTVVPFDSDSSIFTEFVDPLGVLEV